MGNDDESAVLPITLYRGDRRGPGTGFRPVCSFVDRLGDARRAADTAIVLQGGRQPIYSCQAEISRQAFLDARSDRSSLFNLLGPLPEGKRLYDHVHERKVALIDAGYAWVAFRQEDEWIEFVYLDGDSPIPAARVPDDDVMEACKLKHSG